jgi:hypothetical protein
MPRNLQLSILRGILANMPTLADGEFYFATDQFQLYVGLGGNNLPIGGTMAVNIDGHANPNNYLEPNRDGSINANATLVPGGSVSLGTAAGKTAVLKTGQLTTTAVTANQVVLTYTVTAGKTFFIEYIDIGSRLTAVSATASVLGAAIIQIGGVTVYTGTFVNPTTSDSGSQAIRLMFTEPIPITAATVVAVLTTPAATTSMLWTSNFGGYEK